MMKGTRERENKTGQLFVYIFPFVRLSSIERDERRENGWEFFLIYPLLIFLFFSPPLKKPKRYLPLPLFPHVFVLLFFSFSLAKNHFQTPTTVDNKSEIIEQKKQSETPLASARANAEQRWKRGNQSKRISSRVISVRFIRVPRSFSLKNRAQGAGWLLRISPFLYGGMFLSPLFVLPFAYKKSTKNRAKIIKKHSENETANTYALRQLARERRFSRKPSKISSKKSSAQRQRGMKIE